jgi:phytoene/squalene synthetase
MNVQQAHQRVAEKVRLAQSSFYLAMRLQPRDLKHALFAIYAYCRELDDIADGAGTASEKNQKLDSWQRTIDGLFSGVHPHRMDDEALIFALHDTRANFTLPEQPFYALIRGMRTDVSGRFIAPSWPDLLSYCANVAGSVGELCLAVWGWNGRDAKVFAQIAGEALQLTNILRDVYADARVGRLYLPGEVLHDAGISTRDPMAVASHPALKDACFAIAEETRSRFDKIAASWPDPCPPTLRSAQIMIDVYKALFEKISKRGWRDIERVSLSPPEKAFYAARAFFTHP